MTFADKLKRFKSERVGFKVETEEIAKGLCEVFQMDHMNHRDSKEPMSISKFRHGFDGTVITNGFYGIGEGVSIGKMHCTGANLEEILPVTSQELQRYLKIRKGIQENLEVYFPTPTREIYDELMNTLDSFGCRWASKDKSMEYDGFTSDHKVRVSDSKVITIDGLDEPNESSVVVSLTSEPPTPSQTITIVSDGYRKVTAESNGITTEATCCPTDTFSIAKGTHMALQRLLEKQKEADVKPKKEFKFRKGDIVEVIVGGILGAPNDSQGIQGVVQGNCRNPFVKFPVHIGRSDTWCYTQDNLKLIRRNPCE